MGDAHCESGGQKTGRSNHCPSPGRDEIAFFLSAVVALVAEGPSLASFSSILVGV